MILSKESDCCLIDNEKIINENHNLYSNFNPIFFLFT